MPTAVCCLLIPLTETAITNGERQLMLGKPGNSGLHGHAVEATLVHDALLLR